jgi:hypothetical protein
VWHRIGSCSIQFQHPGRDARRKSQGAKRNPDDTHSEEPNAIRECWRADERATGFRTHPHPECGAPSARRDGQAASSRVSCEERGHGRIVDPSHNRKGESGSPLPKARCQTSIPLAKTMACMFNFRQMTRASARTLFAFNWKLPNSRLLVKCFGG